jgi:hypothetical protein
MAFCSMDNHDLFTGRTLKVCSDTGYCAYAVSQGKTADIDPGHGPSLREGCIESQLEVRGLWKGNISGGGQLPSFEGMRRKDECA